MDSDVILKESGTIYVDQNVPEYRTVKDVYPVYYNTEWQSVPYFNEEWNNMLVPDIEEINSNG